jgi:hypothetical protein
MCCKGSSILLYSFIKIKLYKRKYKCSNILVFISFAFAYILYFCSLEICTLGEHNCCKKMNWIKKKIFEEAVSCILTIVLFELMLLKKISKLHLIHFIIVFFLFYCYSHGFDFEDHGNYNIKFFFVIVIPSLILLFILNKIVLAFKKKNLNISIFLILILLFLSGYRIKKFINCKDWAKGLNNTYIDNNKSLYGCQIQLPESCPYKIGKYFLDRNKYFPLDCKKIGFSPKEKLLLQSNSPYINKNTLHIGFPLVNKNEQFFTFYNLSSFRRLYFKNLIDMNNSTLLDLLADKKPEISVDFSENENGKMHIHLIKNKSISDERKKLEGNIVPYSNNIIVIYLDSVSRAYSIRQLKKTLKFFENFILYKGNNNPKYPSENFHSFQFFKYHSFKHWTDGNYPILFYGNYRKPDNKLITSHLKKIGFVTCFASDNCLIDYTPHSHKYSFSEAYDHQSIICDPNNIYPNSRLDCFYGKINVEHMLDYINQFWREYKDNRKFSVLLTNFAHEGSLERLKYIDNIIYEHFNKLFNDNLLKDTSIFLLSDHGVGVPSLYSLEKFYKYELILPMFYLFINDRKNISYESQYKYLNENQQTFITGFDIYSTIVHLAYGDKYKTNVTKNIIKTNYGKSLFTKINQKERNPRNYQLMFTYACI